MDVPYCPLESIIVHYGPLQSTIVHVHYLHMYLLPTDTKNEDLTIFSCNANFLIGYVFKTSKLVILVILFNESKNGK